MTWINRFGLLLLIIAIIAAPSEIEVADTVFGICFSIGATFLLAPNLSVK